MKIEWNWMKSIFHFSKWKWMKFTFHCYFILFHSISSLFHSSSLFILRNENRVKSQIRLIFTYKNFTFHFSFLKMKLDENQFHRYFIAISSLFIAFHCYFISKEAGSPISFLEMKIEWKTSYKKTEILFKIL